MMLVSPAVSYISNFSLIYMHIILLFTANALTVGAIIGIVLASICVVSIIICLIVFCLCFCIPGCPCYCSSTQHRRHWIFFPAHSTQPQTAETSVTYTTSTHQQQSILKAADPLPSKEVPYEVDQPPPYQIYDPQNYPPPPTNAF